MWRLKDEALERTKQENAKEMVRMLNDLGGKISEIRKIEAGINFKDDTNGFDVALYSEFDNLNDLNTYQNHPEHLRVAEFIREVVKERAFVDYHFE
jgi:hypothetical protein